MRSVAYLCNQFPEPLEPYVRNEIAELRQHGCSIVPCSMRRPGNSFGESVFLEPETTYAFPLRWKQSFAATFVLLIHFRRVAALLWRVVRGPEPVSQRLRAIAHTWLGAYLAVLLRGKRIRHIHVHHGYFSSWVGMVASRLLKASFSMTLHGSDLLVRGDYLDCKLEQCRFCVTISDFNRDYILERYPAVNPEKVVVHRLGIDLQDFTSSSRHSTTGQFSILSVGRLHKIKNHGFLVLACRALKARGLKFKCMIAGEGEEHGTLNELVRTLGLEEEVTLLGHIPRTKLPELYGKADVVVLTSRSEGIPVTLMEAMAMERVVLAPEITGIPELVVPGKTGLLYEPNCMEDFLAKLNLIRVAKPSLDRLRRAARNHIEWNFNQDRNLADFAQDFLHRLGEVTAFAPTDYEDPLLQQVQLPVQRDRNVSV
jgi:colanic acid/amylovoran biosynthesis glycosyltransferase